MMHIAGILLAALSTTAPPADASALDVAAIDAFIAEQLDASGLPGMAIAITRGDEVLHLRGYGHDADGVAITEHTPFRVASISKSITATSVMQLVDEGRIGLDDAVVVHLPEFVTVDARAQAITVRQLLDQTSGMSDRGFPEISRPQPSTLAGAVERLRDAELVADPGTEFNYHNPNAMVAARLVEVVRGEPFAEVLRRHVFAPLGMGDSSTTDLDTQRTPGLARGHTFAYGFAVPVEGPGYFVGGAGGVVTTAADMARWLIANVNDGVAADGTRLVSAEGMHTLHTPREAGGYALGWDADGPLDAPTRIDHGGCCFAWSAHQTLLPQTGHGIAVLFAGASPLGADQMEISEGVVAIVEGRPVERELPVTAGTIDRILGTITLVVLGLVALGVRRRGKWVQHARQRPRWRAAVRVAPHLVVIAGCLAFPTLAGLLFGGRNVTWFSLFYGWFALGVLVVCTGAGESALLLARALAWRRL
ncbi:MAG: beta-lactamase family protein [Myxococcales bacterium]|nr:beta-lactamase family protein [Myxococcales bacterium]